MKKDAYKCIIECTPDPFDPCCEAGTVEYAINEESGELHFNANLYLTYKLDNEKLDVTAVLDNPCDCSCSEKHFVLQLNESKSIFWGHRGHSVFYSVTFAPMQH